MRFATPMYDGDSIIRRGPDVQTEAPKAQMDADSTPKMLHSNNNRSDTALVLIDTFEIERRARALRAAAMRSAWASFRGWMRRSLESARRRRADEHVARARSVAELEARLHKLERSSRVVHI